MRRIYVNAQGLENWQERLASPIHWKRKHSAYELAVAWENAASLPRGLPIQVAEVLDQCKPLRDAAVLFAIPEHTVELEGTGRPSQSDLWALLRSATGLISLAVEAKAGEPFGKFIGEWLGTTTNRQTRLSGLCQTLNVSASQPGIAQLRYQLFHRTASAVLEARRCGAGQAVMLVQSFQSNTQDFEDFRNFAQYLGATVTKNGLSIAPCVQDITLCLGWIDCPFADDADVARASRPLASTAEV